MALLTAVGALIAGLANVAAVAAAGGAITLATFLVPAGIAAVGGFILSRLTPQVDPQGFEVTGASARTVRGAVLPLRWIVGRARVAGALVWVRESGRNLDLIYVLGAGPMDAIEEIWIDGQPQGISFVGDFNSGAEGRPTQGRRAGRSGEPLFRAYLSGDPEQIIGTPRVVDQFSMSAPRPWTSAHQLRGLAWVHVALHQPDYGTNIDNRVWTQVPEFHFLVRGLKFTHPRNPETPAWTQNAAAIRYWWLTVRRGIPADNIDATHYEAAFDVCDEFLRLDGLEGFTDEYLPNFHRYSINGVIIAGDRVEAVEANMDAAWAGNVVEFDGIHRFLPGIDRPVTATIGPDDIVESPTFRPAPEHHERVNQLTARIAQSLYHDFTEYALAEVDDDAAQERDRELLPADLGTLSFVNDPVQGFSIIAKQLRRERAVAQIDLIVRPGDGFENVTLAPGEVVALTIAEWELDAARYLVLASEVEEDWRVRLSLIQQPDGIYADTLQLPPLGTRSFVPATPPDNVPVLAEIVLETSYEEPGTALRTITAQPPGDPVDITWAWDVIRNAEGYQYQFQPAGTDAQEDGWIGTTAREIRRSAYDWGGDFATSQIGAWQLFVRARSGGFAIADSTIAAFDVVYALHPPGLTVRLGETRFFSDGEERVVYRPQVYFTRSGIQAAAGDTTDRRGAGVEYEFGNNGRNWPGTGYNFTYRSFPSSGRVTIFTFSGETQSRTQAEEALEPYMRCVYRSRDAGRTPTAYSRMQFTEARI